MEQRIGIVGGGPAALLVYKRLVDLRKKNLSVTIFEASNKLGVGMPYSKVGASDEHVTNVSGDEIPPLGHPLTNWIKSLPSAKVNGYGIDQSSFHEKEVLPRLLFGEYLADQFQSLIEKGESNGTKTEILLETQVTDIYLDPKSEHVIVCTEQDKEYEFDQVVICTGHHWPVSYEGRVEGYFDSPYPPSKLSKTYNHTIAVRGSSLTAIDAIKSLARANGNFKKSESGLTFVPNSSSPNFKIEMYSKTGLLPSLRVHMEEPHMSDDAVISDDKIQDNRNANNGFVELNFLFDEAFKKPLREKDPALYNRVKDMKLEEFVDTMMTYRENQDPFSLLKKELEQSIDSIQAEQPVPWKELLASLSFAMNYPAKYLAAEDMMRLQKILMPLISVIIAFLPQSSCEELLALHDSGKLDLICDRGEGKIEVLDDNKINYSYHSNDKEVTRNYQTFVDCVGQPHLSLEEFPFKSLVKSAELTAARLRFKDPELGKTLFKEKHEHVEKIQEEYFLRVPGVAVTDEFNIVNSTGKKNSRIYLMAVPFIGGFNPDYSGLDFCEHASELVVNSIAASS